MSPLYHGVSVRDAAMMIGVPEQTVRKWLHRGNIERTTDGQVDPVTLQEWWDYKRDARLGKRGPVHRAKHNPYGGTGAPSDQASA